MALAAYARASRNARQGQSGGLHDGSTSICSRPCSRRLDANPEAMLQETVEHPFAIGHIASHDFLKKVDLLGDH
jgi:hypothetical protein